MRIPTVILEGKRLPRVIFSVGSSLQDREILSLLRKAYDLGAWYVDLPSLRHLGAFRELKHLTEDEGLTGLCHVEVEEGASLFGKPLHLFESKVISTIIRNLFPPQLVRNLREAGVWTEKLFFPLRPSSEVLTQKEIDRISFDLSRFERALSPFRLEESPLLSLGGRYADWLLALGRVDLISEMASRVKEKGFVPIFSGRWATFVLPKVKPLALAAYAVPINQKWSLFDLAQASVLIKKFDKPVISLNPLADGRLLERSEAAFSFLFNELKVYSAIAEITSEGEVTRMLDALKDVPSLTPMRKA